MQTLKGFVSTYFKPKTVTNTIEIHEKEIKNRYQLETTTSTMVTVLSLKARVNLHRLLPRMVNKSLNADKVLRETFNYRRCRNQQKLSSQFKY